MDIAQPTVQVPKQISLSLYFIVNGSFLIVGIYGVRVIINEHNMKELNQAN